MDQTSVETFNHSGQGPSPKIYEFLNVQLRPKAGYCISTEYPALFGDYPGGASVVSTINGLVAGHVGFVAREFVCPGVRLKIGLIGSVVTAPEFRNHGIACDLMGRAISDLKARGCLVACLWADDTAFYEQFGFYRAGREIDFRFDASSFPGDLEPSIEFDERIHTHLVWRLYQKHPLRLDRSLEEQKRLVRVPRARLFLTRQGNEISSYIAVNKGADFTDYIHEWGGELAEVQKNIAGTQKHFFNDRSLTMIAPASYELSKIRAIASQEGKGVVGTLAVLDRSMLVSHYSSFLRREGVEHSLVGSKLRFQKDEFPFVTSKEVLQHIFGDAGEPRHPVLPFFLWGFDSI